MLKNLRCITKNTITIFLCFLLSTFLFLTHSSAYGDVGDEFQVNTYTSGYQSSPNVDVFSNGNFVVVWDSEDQDGDDMGIYVQIFDEQGSKIGGEILVNTHTDYSQAEPKVAVLSDDRFAVVWYSLYQDTSNWGVYAQIFDSSGSKVGSEFIVNDYISGNQYNSHIAALENGQFLVTWISPQDTSGFGVYGKIFNSSGVEIVGEFRVNTYIIGKQSAPNAALLSNGNFVVTWQSEEQDTSSWGAYGRIFDSSGSEVVEEFLINTCITDEQVRPSVNSFTNGTFIVIWESKNQDGDGWGVYGQIFNNNGTKIGEEFRVNTNIIDHQLYQTIAIFENNRFVAVWLNCDDDGLLSGDNYRISAQVFDASGNKLGDEFQVNTSSTSFQYYPSVVKLEDGNFVIVWPSLNQDGSSWGVFGRIFTLAPMLTASKTTTTVCDFGSTVIDNEISILDVDNYNLQSAAITMSGDVDLNLDYLEFTNQNGITGFYNDSTGELTLAGVASVSDYQTALRNVTYKHYGAFLPLTNSITVSFVVNDGADDSNTVDVEISALGCPANNTPTISDVSKLGVVDAASQFSAADFINQFNDTDVGDSLRQIQVTSLPASGGTLKLSGIDVGLDQEIIVEELDDLSFIPNPSWTGTTDFNWQGFDFRSSSNTAAVNIDIKTGVPLIATSSETTVCDCDATIIIDNALNVTDANSASLQSAKVKMLGDVDLNVDFLEFTNQNGIFGFYDDDTGELSLVGSSSIENYQAALRSVLYKHVGTSKPSKSIIASFVANDGTNDGNTAYVNINSNSCPVGNVPTISGISKEGIINTPLLFSAVDFTSQFNDTDIGDTLRQIRVNNLPLHGVLKLSEQDVAAGQEILVENLGSFSLIPEVDWSGATNFNWQGYDCISASDAATVNIDIKTDEPIITTISKKSACGCDISIPIDNTLNLTDVNSDYLQRAKIAMSGDVDLAFDSLEFTNQNGINGFYDQSTGGLSLVGQSSLYRRA